LYLNAPTQHTSLTHARRHTKQISHAPTRIATVLLSSSSLCRTGNSSNSVESQSSCASASVTRMHAHACTLAHLQNRRAVGVVIERVVEQPHSAMRQIVIRRNLRAHHHHARTRNHRTHAPVPIRVARSHPSHHHRHRHHRSHRRRAPRCNHCGRAVPARRRSCRTQSAESPRANRPCVCERDRDAQYTPFDTIIARILQQAPKEVRPREVVDGILEWHPVSHPDACARHIPVVI
jgi:hypothetical protein